jgi:hypothetical protein
MAGLAFACKAICVLKFAHVLVALVGLASSNMVLYFMTVRLWPNT